MNIVRKLLGLFVPLEADPKPPGGGDPEGKPDWCPDKFYDPDTGPRTQVAMEAFTELEGKMREGQTAFETQYKADLVANTPESYKINIPKDLEVPAGVEITLKDDDPVAEWFMGFAREQGLTQEQVDEAVGAYIKLEVAGLPNMEDEIKLLGDYGQDRMMRVTTWLNTTLKGKDTQLAAMQPLLTSAAAVEGLETLMKGHSPNAFDGDGGSTGLTLQELQKMQSTPEYLGGQDKAIQKQVADGYARLYNR